jgi:hypothetical protein
MSGPAGPAFVETKEHRMTTLRIPTSQFRSLPQPSGTGKIGVFYTRAQHVPDELWNWRDVNPRDVKTTTRVYTDIVDTLVNEPARFHERNRGLTISAAELEFDDKRREVVISMDDPKLHGVVDGGHTLHAIIAAKTQPKENGWPADVFLKVLTHIPPEQIAEIAGGLNSSQQVDQRSLENLNNHFQRLKDVLSGQPYADKIAYKMNQDQPIDVREILYYLAVFDCDEYSDLKHPTALFGRKEGIVRTFASQAEAGAGSFDILISRAPEILALRDEIEKRVLNQAENIGLFRVGKNERVRSKKNLENFLYFLDIPIEGKIPLGWIMPMLGAFRANVHWDKANRAFDWIVSNETLLDDCLDGLIAGIKDIHATENSRPEYVGRNAMSWRICYERVQNAILRRELKGQRG